MASPTPSDWKLYNFVKACIYKTNPIHSAYRSGALVKEYKRCFAAKYGPDASPYIGKKSQKTGLTRWFQEEWRNQRGEIGYAFSNDVYRPTKIITKNTPITFREISKSPKRLKSAMREKSQTGRVRKF